MKQAYKIILFIICFISLKPIQAQDPEFTQFYANPLYLNPAFAGSNICPRITMNYRNQWPGISGTYVTTSISADRFVYGIKSGIGIMVMNDRAGQGTLNTTNISGIYSYQWRPTRRFAINVGFQATYGQKKLDWSKLTFGDMIDERRGFVKNTEEVPGRSQRSFVDISAGAVGFSKRFFIGFAAHHLNEPDEGLIYSSKLPRKYTAHAGAIIPVGDKNSETTISPNILYQQQQDFRQLNLGVYITKGSLVGGLWYRNQDSFIVLLGLQHGIFKIGYSYDVTVSKLTNATAGSHEVSLGMQFTCKKPKPKYRPGVCPSF
ncbi:MAG: type IX secretion system membrane protein PorP/SprF [Bacteroidia bacterium]|nr:type IX secretion system membrane protein PorP/SprF [Bacteroidia bacterium]